MKTTKKTQYALRAMIILSRERSICSLRAIAEEEEISFDYLEKVFSRLEKKGLVISKRGVSGGYFLSREPREITLKDIFDAVEEPISIVDCIKKGCRRDKNCRASTAWKKVNKRVESALLSVKLSELVK